MNKLFLIVGPSGSGKTILVRALQAKGMKEVVSYTSRTKRSGETDGVDYHYVNKDWFKDKVDQGFFVEHVQYAGNYYGLSFGSINNALAAGDALIIVEPNGARQIKEFFPDNAVTVFLEPPNDEELRRRMTARGDSTEVIEKRLASVPKESEFYLEADFIIGSGTPAEALAAAEYIIEQSKLNAS